MDTSVLPKTRAEAKITGSKYYFTGEPCKHGHISPRKTKGSCLECCKVEWEASKVTRADYFAAYNKSEAGQASKKRYYAGNKDKVIAAALARPKEDADTYRKRWADANKEAIQANTNARRRRLRIASPKWLSRAHRSEIRAVYREAISMTASTGVKHEVDHIVPLNSEVVSGLHVPWNLRVITKVENRIKSNSLPDFT